MSTPRKIELESYAVVRATGREVQVTAKYFNRSGLPTWGCDDGREYQAHELRPCSKEVYEQIMRERIDEEERELERGAMENFLRDIHY